VRKCGYLTRDVCKIVLFHSLIVINTLEVTPVLALQKVIHSISASAQTH